MVYKIDPKVDREWVDEFRKRPVRPHSPQLQRMLNTLPQWAARRALCADLHEPLLRMGARTPSGGRGKPFEILDQYRFSSLDEAEWAVFRLRWKEHTGQDSA